MKVRHNAPTRLHMLAFVCDCGRENKCLRHRRVRVLCACGRMYQTTVNNLGDWVMSLIGKGNPNG